MSNKGPDDHHAPPSRNARADRGPGLSTRARLPRQAPAAASRRHEDRAGTAAARYPRGDKFNEHRIDLDHISLGIAGAELERLADELSAAGVQTCGIQRDALGPALVCFRDPDNIARECFQND